jgi:methylthioribose-1-phosphate isomerase
MQTVRPIEWIPDSPGRLTPGRLRFLDQVLLPVECRYRETRDLGELWTAIKTLQIRGAPAIGVAAAMGVALGAQQAPAGQPAEILAAAERAADYLATSRPTAVNLFWALDRMRRAARALAALPHADWAERIAGEAVAIRDEDAAMCRRIGAHGATLLRDGDAILTHCNAGALATSEFGTALAPVYAALEQGKRIAVYADETRPLLQGARLTAWELMQAGVDVTLICDNMAAQVMREGRVRAVLVGADRIAANGDTANKVGTYGVAVLARAHHIPFYVLAPTSTFDLAAATGAAIPIEQRGAEEITHGFGRRTAPENVKVYNPAFDVTPAELITAIVCEHGIVRPDYRASIAAMAG